MEHQPQHSTTQKTHRPTKRDIFVVTSIGICLMGVLSLVMYGACIQMHASPLVWPVLLTTIWLPGGGLLVLFPFSRWSDSARKQAES